MRISGVLLFIIGLILTLDLFNVFTARPFFGLLNLLGPVLLFCGIFILLFGNRPGIILFLGIIMLTIGGFPWIYTPYLMGTRGGDEGSGMMGTLIFIFVGIPGIVAILLGLILLIFGKD